MIVVSGGPSQHEADRSVDDSSLRPVQALVGDGFVSLERFIPQLGRGVSNMVEADGEIWWTDGTDLHVDDAAIEIDALDDVHELATDGSKLLVANTGAEECLVLQRSSREVIERFRVGDSTLHLNQVFVGLDGRRMGLVHHVEGRQISKRVAGRLLKIQGDGGVIELDTGRRRSLRLTAPHSARIVGDEMWIADSGRARILRYDERWQLLGSIPTAGWGRGAVVAGTTFWLGLSPLRPRYRGFVEGPAVDRPEVHAFDVESHSVVAHYVLEGIDQVNGVHDISEPLLGLNEEAERDR